MSSKDRKTSNVKTLADKCGIIVGGLGKITDSDYDGMMDSFFSSRYQDEKLMIIITRSNSGPLQQESVTVYTPDLKEPVLCIASHRYTFKRSHDKLLPVKRWKQDVRKFKEGDWIKYIDTLYNLTQAKATA